MMDIWLSCIVVFYVVNSSLAVSRPEEKKLIYDFWKNAPNEVLSDIWEQEPVTFCKILKPSENSLRDKAFLTYNFNQFLCVILSDASSRYLNLSAPLNPRDEQELFKAVFGQTPPPNEFCDKMKKTNWTTYIEENIIWLQEFNRTMNNETLCRRYCVAGFINPLCAYTLWLEELIEEGEHRQELQLKFEASQSPPISIKSRVSNHPPPRQGPIKVLPSQLQAHRGSPSIVPASPSDSQVLVDHGSSARIPDPAVGLGSGPVNGVETDVTRHLTSNGDGHLLVGDMNTIPKTSEVKGGNSQIQNVQNSQHNYPEAVHVNTKPKIGLKPSKSTDLTTEGKPHVSVSSPMKATKGSLLDPKNSTDEVVSGRRPDSNTLSNAATSRNVSHVEVDEVKHNSPASVTNVISDTNHNDKEKLASVPMQLPKHGTDAKTAVSVGREKADDFTLEHPVETDPKTLVEPEDKEAANEGIPDVALQLEPSNHDQKDREDILDGEDPEAMERPEEQSPEGDLVSAEPRFGGEIEEPANGRSTSPKNFDYVSEDDPILPINGVEQEKVTQNDAGAGMYVHDRFVDAEDSHFFAYFMTMIILCILGYLIFHNKQKILALALEGRARKGNRRRPSTSGYRKLDSNLEEAVTSNCAGASVTHVIY